MKTVVLLNLMKHNEQDATGMENILKIISLEEHYRLPAIEDLAKSDDPYMLMKKALTKSGLYKSGPQSGRAAALTTATRAGPCAKKRHRPLKMLG